MILQAHLCNITIDHRGRGLPAWMGAPSVTDHYDRHRKRLTCRSQISYGLFFDGAGDWTHGLVHVRQAGHRWATSQPCTDFSTNFYACLFLTDSELGSRVKLKEMLVPQAMERHLGQDLEKLRDLAIPVSAKWTTRSRAMCLNYSRAYSAPTSQWKWPLLYHHIPNPTQRSLTASYKLGTSGKVDLVNVVLVKLMSQNTRPPQCYIVWGKVWIK